MKVRAALLDRDNVPAVDIQQSQVNRTKNFFTVNKTASGKDSYS